MIQDYPSWVSWILDEFTFNDIYIYIYILIYTYIYILSYNSTKESESDSLQECTSRALWPPGPPWPLRNVHEWPRRATRRWRKVTRSMDTAVSIYKYRWNDIIWLVVWNIFYFSIYWDWLVFFRGVETTNQNIRIIIDEMTLCWWLLSINGFLIIVVINQHLITSIYLT